MVTGEPSAENAIKSLNAGASFFLTKPINPTTLLANINEKLKEKTEKRNNQKKVDQWVKVRLSRVQINEYSSFSEETSAILSEFGLNKTKSRIYIAVNTLGSATVSEVAMLSKVRREEVYRVLSDLERSGVIIGKLETPRRFTALDPKLMIENLIKNKIHALEHEIDILNSKKEQLISKLANTSFGVYEESSIEALSKLENPEARIKQTLLSAKYSILLVSSPDGLIQILEDNKKEKNIFLNKISVRLIVGTRDDLSTEKTKGEFMPFLNQISALSKKLNILFELKKIDKIPFKLIIADRKEAIWGAPMVSDQKFLWTNDMLQVGILKRAFDNLWEEAESI